MKNDWTGQRKRLASVALSVGSVENKYRTVAVCRRLALQLPLSHTLCPDISVNLRPSDEVTKARDRRKQSG